MNTLSSSVKSAVQSILISEKFTTPPSINVTSGSESGDGYASKTAAITIMGNGKQICLFVKYFPDEISNKQVDLFKSLFDTEFRFYEKVFPEMLRFQAEKKVNIFDNVPKHYTAAIKEDGIPPIILDNIKASGYTLRNMKETADKNHISLVLKTYAKLHAISFAMKDQNPAWFKNISDEMEDSYAQKLFDVGFDDVLIALTRDFIKTLDPVIEKTVIDRCTSFCESLTEFILSTSQFTEEYSVICHSDGWSNNLMFLYDEETKIPIHLKIIDWQVHRIIPPVLEIAHVFYGLARKEALSNFEYYRTLYYDTLVDHITKLGSDPKTLYPKEVFMEQWSKFAKFGLIMSFALNRVAFLCKDETTDLIDRNDGKMPFYPTQFKERNQYHGIMKDIVEHFVQNGFL